MLDKVKDLLLNPFGGSKSDDDDCKDDEQNTTKDFFDKVKETLTSSLRSSKDEAEYQSAVIDRPDEVTENENTEEIEDDDESTDHLMDKIKEMLKTPIDSIESVVEYSSTKLENLVIAEENPIDQSPEESKANSDETHPNLIEKFKDLLIEVSEVKNLRCTRSSSRHSAIQPSFTAFFDSHKNSYQNAERRDELRVFTIFSHSHSHHPSFLSLHDHSPEHSRRLTKKHIVYKIMQFNHRAHV